jgi:hypothetical protein
MHRTTERFWQCYQRLPNDAQKIAQKNFRLLQRNARHPSLLFKKIGGVWSARVGLAYRALAVQDGEDFTWVWIGGHHEYEKLLKGH